jgi:hypothetical protein
LKLNPVILCPGCKKSLRLSIEEQEGGSYACPNCQKTYDEQTYQSLLLKIEPQMAQERVRLEKSATTSAYLQILAALVIFGLPTGLFLKCVVDYADRPERTAADSAYDHGQVNGMSAGFKGAAPISDLGLHMVARTHYPNDYASQAAFEKGFKKGYQVGSKK